jgi:hypothetical protein
MIPEKACPALDAGCAAVPMTIVRKITGRLGSI